jgi:hypothetical protein
MDRQKKSYLGCKLESREEVLAMVVQAYNPSTQEARAEDDSERPVRVAQQDPVSPPTHPKKVAEDR